MTKEQVQDRIKTLEAERDQMLSTYNGAIQDCTFWLSQFEKPIAIQQDVEKEIKD